MKSTHYVFRLQLIKRSPDGRSVLRDTTHVFPFIIAKKKDEPEIGPECDEYLQAVHEDIANGFAAFFERCRQDAEEDKGANECN